jgi:hypothetical protein
MSEEKKKPKPKKAKVLVLRNCCDLEGNQLKKGQQVVISSKPLDALKGLKAVK